MTPNGGPSGLGELERKGAAGALETLCLPDGPASKCSHQGPVARGHTLPLNICDFNIQLKTIK